MVFLNIIILFFIITCAYASNCISWQCANLPKDVCAVWNAEEILINKAPCSSGKVCSILELEMRTVWYREGTLECEKSVVPKRDKVRKCNSYDSEQKLEDNHPSECMNDKDCLRMDGTYAKCRCAFDGRKFCTYSSGDLEAEFYHDSCEIMTDEDAYHYSLHYHLSHILFTAPSCVAIFDEINYSRYFQNKYKN